MCSRTSCLIHDVFHCIMELSSFGGEFILVFDENKCGFFWIQRKISHLQRFCRASSCLGVNKGRHRQEKRNTGDGSDHYCSYLTGWCLCVVRSIINHKQTNQCWVMSPSFYSEKSIFRRPY